MRDSPDEDVVLPSDGDHVLRCGLSKLCFHLISCAWCALSNQEGDLFYLDFGLLSHIRVSMAFRQLSVSGQGIARLFPIYCKSAQITFVALFSI